MAADNQQHTEVSGAQRSFAPMHAIIRIDEVEKEGTAKVTDSSGQNSTPFPMPMPKSSGSYCGVPQVPDSSEFGPAPL
ncbi:MAG: DUF1820 family protein [Dehalococcoidia bacterium]|nr:DUF1820 family protein [Dehalococcoidia bacterium]